MPRITRTRLQAVVATIGLLTVAVCGVRLSEAKPDAQLIRGSVGEQLELTEGTVGVTEVRVGTTLQSFSRVETTTGMFVLVQLESSAPGRRELRMGTVSLLADDAPTYRPYTTTSGVIVPPGFVQTTEVAFEVDPARIADLTVNLEPTEIVSGYQQHVQIHLGITADNAAGWLAAAQGRTLEPAQDALRGIG